MIEIGIFLLWWFLCGLAVIQLLEFAEAIPTIKDHKLYSINVLVQWPLALVAFTILLISGKVE